MRASNTNPSVNAAAPGAAKVRRRARSTSGCADPRPEGGAFRHHLLRHDDDRGAAPGTSKEFSSPIRIESDRIVVLADAPYQKAREDLKGKIIGAVIATIEEMRARCRGVGGLGRRGEVLRRLFGAVPGAAEQARSMRLSSISPVSAAS